MISIREKALETVEFKTFHTFFACCSKEVVGCDKSGVPHTLREEVSNVLALINKAGAEETIENISFYSRNIFYFVEMTEDEHRRRSKDFYRQAARKLCYLSSRCKEMSYDKTGFVLQKINFDNEDEVKNLCLSFEWVADNAAELLCKG